MNIFRRSREILGMNARNLLYVGRYNTNEAKRFADNKLYTKNFLTTRGLHAAKVFFVIKSYNELKVLNPKSLPESFVIKPNRGYGGEGIIVITRHNGKIFNDINNDEYTWNELYHHIVSILDGKYAISGLYDQVIIEERLIVNEFFGEFVERGLPDIRIIVFNYVPIIAMLRLPTRESEGKANLHLGAVGVGIDIVTGKATYAVHHNKFIKYLSNNKSIRSIHMPQWDDILLLASKAQQASQIKFLAVDIACTKSGLKILELNARAGLGVQIANQIPLRKRLLKVSDLTITNPEKGVEVSKVLFSAVPKKNLDVKKIVPKKVIGLFEYVDVMGTSYLGLPIKIDPHATETIFDSSLTEIDPDGRYVEISLRGQRIRFPYKVGEIQGEHKAIVGGKVLRQFLIDPGLRETVDIVEATQKLTHKNVTEKILKNLDNKIVEIEKHLNILSYVKPLNYLEEKEKFFNSEIDSPLFLYRKLSVESTVLLREISALPRDIDHPLTQLYVEKIDEIVSKLQLIDSVGTDELPAASEELYGAANKQLYIAAQRYLKQLTIVPDKSKVIGTKLIIKKIEVFLHAYGLENWKVKVVEKQTSDISVNKTGIIFVRKGLKFSKNRLKSVIAHEIATHVFRSENGRLQKYKLLAKGTAHYIETEEGLAIYNQKQLGIDLGKKERWIALRVIAAYHAREMGFRRLFEYMQTQYDLSEEESWKAAFRAKRGLADTAKPGAFTRDMVYFTGYQKIKEYVGVYGREGLRDLYVGKIKLEDISFLQYIGNYQVRYLPPENIDI